MSPTRPNRVPYMKPHIRVATTAGTAYGRKIEIRKKSLPYRRPLSRARATNSAMNSMTGTCTARNAETRPSEVQNRSSASACW